MHGWLKRLERFHTSINTAFLAFHPFSTHQIPGTLTDQVIQYFKNLFTIFQVNHRLPSLYCHSLVLTTRLIFNYFDNPELLFHDYPKYNNVTNADWGWKNGSHFMDDCFVRYMYRDIR